MTPPNGVKTVGSPAIPPQSTQAEGPELVHPDQVVRDPRWSDPLFRAQNMRLSLALKALEDYFSGNLEVEKLQTKLKAWTDSPEFSQEENKEFNQGVVDRIHAQLALFSSQAGAAKAQAVSAMLPAATPMPAGRQTAPEPAPVPAKAPPATPDAQPVIDSYQNPKGFRLGALTFDFHAGDESLRGAPRIFTIGVLPKEGLTHNQSSDFGWVGGAQFSYNDFNFLAGIYQEDMTPIASPAHYHRAGIRLGLLEYAGPTVGERGPGGKFHLSLFGRQRVAMELGSAWCSAIDGSDVSGVECPDSSFQFGVMNNSDTLSLGYGPFEAGVTLLPLKVYLQSEELGLPQINRLPMEFNAAWHFNEPAYAFKPQSSQEVLRDKVGDAEVTMTAMTLGANAMLNNFRRKQEAAFQETRVLSFGNNAQFSLTNAGTFLNGVLSGWSEGSTGYRLSRDFKYGNNGQRAVLASVLGAELAVNLIGLAATPGTPDRVQTFPGQTVPPDADLSGNDGITDLQARAFRLNVPQILLRDGLTTLGALGALGDRNKAIKGESSHHPIAHGSLAGAGALLVLTSGNFSGTGFFGASILGNQPPEGDVIQLRDSDYSLSAQSWQYFRLEAGTQLLAYGFSGLSDFIFGRFKYLDLKDCEERKKSDPEVLCGDEKPVGPKQTALITDPYVNFKLAPGEGMIYFGGKM